MCPEFGGEDSGDGRLCGRRRNKPVPLLYHLPDEPGECLEYDAISEFTLVMVLLSNTAGWRANPLTKRAYFAKSICRIFSTVGASSVMLLPGGVGVFSLHKDCTV